MIWKSIALTKITDTNLCALTQVQLDRLDELVLSETLNVLAPVVQTSDSAIHRINHYPADSVIDFRNTYPLDSDLSGG